MLYSGPVIYLLYFAFCQITDNDFSPYGPSIGNLELFLCILDMYTSLWQGIIMCTYITCISVYMYIYVNLTFKGR